MATYKLAPQLWKKNRDKVIRTYGIMLPGGVLLGLLIGVIPDLRNPGSIGVTLTRMIPVMCVFALVGTLLVWRIVRSARKSYHSYEMILDDDKIVRTQVGVSELIIRREEVTGLQQVNGKGAMVKTSDPSCFLWVPDELEGYETVLDTISGWTPIQAPRSEMPGIYNQKVTIPISIVSLLAIFLVSNPQIVTAVSIFFCGYLVYTVVSSVRNPNCSRGAAIRTAVAVSISVLFIVLRVLTVWNPRS